MKNKSQKLLLLTALIGLLTSCAAMNTAFGPKVVAGNQNFVTVSDAIGAPNGRLNAATQHCMAYGKTPSYQAEGGDSFECSGNTFCVTYKCN